MDRHDATLILIAYGHGLRVGELVRLRWDQLDLHRGTMPVNRTKNGDVATHPVSGRELRALRQLKRFYGDSPFLFVTERGGPITEATVRKNNGVDTRTIQAYLGHRNIMHTVRYTQLAPDRFRTLWRD